MLYFKLDGHVTEMQELLKAFGIRSLYQSKEHTVLCYYISAVFKGKYLIDDISEDGLNMEGIEEKLLSYSPSESGLIRFGLQLFNPTMDDITIPEVFFSLDEENSKVLISGLAFRYGVEVTMTSSGSRSEPEF